MWYADRVRTTSKVILKREPLSASSFYFRKVISKPTICNKASPEEFTLLLFFTCDYNKSLIPQTDLRTINKYKRKRNISSVTKTASKGIEFLTLLHLFPSKAGVLQRKESKDMKIIKIVKGSSFSQDLVISGEKWS